jgi:hypothetical protein
MDYIINKIRLLDSNMAKTEIEKSALIKASIKKKKK